MLYIGDIWQYLQKEFNSLCKEFNITNCEFFFGKKETLLATYIEIYKKYLTPTEALQRAQYELFGYGFMSSVYLYFIDKKTKKVNKADIKYYVILLEDNIYRLYYDLKKYHVKYTDDELKEFLKICLRHEIGHIIDFQTAIKKAKDVDAWSKKRCKLGWKELEDYNLYLETLYENFYKKNSKEKAEIRYLDAKKYNSMTSEVTANKLSHVDINKLNELCAKFLMIGNEEDIE